MGWTEVLGFVSGAVCVWLTVRRNIWNFPVGIAKNLVFLVLFLQVGLYADAGLQVVYVALGAAGWYWWLRGGDDHGALDIRHTPRWGWPLAALGVAVLTGLLWTVLTRHTDSTRPLADAATTALSLVAQVMLNRKWIGHWALWITADAIYIWLYAAKGLGLTSVLYALFLALCVAGVRQWRAALPRPTVGR